VNRFNVHDQSGGSPVPEPDEYWQQLQNAATNYASHGWPVVPGVHIGDHRAGWWPLPDSTAWPLQEPLDTNAISHYWQKRPYAILLATGYAFRIIALSEPLAVRIFTTMNKLSQVGPVALFPEGPWTFFIGADSPLPVDLLGRSNVRHYGLGMSVPAAPTQIGGHHIRWLIPPEKVSWQLFDTSDFYDLIRFTLGDAMSNEATPRT